MTDTPSLWAHLRDSSTPAYNWLRDALIPGESALIESLWLFAWLTFGPKFYFFLDRQSKITSPNWSLLAIVFAIAAPALAGRWLEFRYPREFNRRRWLLTAAVAVVFALFVKTQGVPQRSILDWRWLVDVVFPWIGVEPSKSMNLLSVTWFGGILLVARGVWLATSEIDEESATRWFLGGLAAFLLLIGLMVFWQWELTLQVEIGALLAAYFCIGLSWLGLIKQQEIEERVYGRALSRLRVSWLALFGAISLSIFGLGVAVAAIQGYIRGGAGEVAQDSAPIAGGIWNAIGVAQVAFLHAIFRFLAFIFQFLPASWLDLLRQASGDSTTTQDPNPSQLGGPALPLPPHIQETIIGILLLVALYFILRRIRYVRLAARDETDEQSSLWSWDLLLSQIQDLSPKRRTRRAGRARARRSPSAPAPAAHPVRALYQDVLRWSRDRNRAKAASATPHEFAPELEHLLPQELAAEITAAYVNVRYAEEDLDVSRAEQLRSAWQAQRR
ncbi:MAG TPA: DUF4129 domain-containing protein [Chloroflexota bacterium]|nr:DUF4129 domain-containing protein [Chloroflexota bacterium]